MSENVAEPASYSQRFFAWLLDYTGPKQGWRFEPLKHKMFTEDPPSGVILEIGLGAAPNLSYYKDKAEEVIGLDPNSATHAYALKRAESAQFPLEKLRLITAGAEKMPLDDNTIDAVVCTHVLCSVNDPKAAVKECLRVLKPGGKFYCMEHIHAKEDTSLRTAQNYINPLVNVIACGCNVTRDTPAVLNNAGFSKVELEEVLLDFPFIGRVFAPHVFGVCTK